MSRTAQNARQYRGAVDDLHKRAFDPTLPLDELFAGIWANPPKPHDKDNRHG